VRSVVLLGKGDLAVRVAEWFRREEDWRLTRVVPVMPEPAWTDSLSGWADRNDVRRVKSGNWADLPIEPDRRLADLAISVFYDRILPAELLACFGRALNIHNGPLPRYRGVSPINWALKNGESTHGVTIHEIAPGIDDGPVVSQLSYSIYPEQDEVEDVYRRALAYGWTLFEQTMPLLDRIEAVPQDERQALYYGLEDNDLLGERRSFRRELSETR
jgi:methionyl-tRNA formyltransferase